MTHVCNGFPCPECWAPKPIKGTKKERIEALERRVAELEQKVIALQTRPWGTPWWVYPYYYGQPYIHTIPCGAGFGVATTGGTSVVNQNTTGIYPGNGSTLTFSTGTSEVKCD